MYLKKSGLQTDIDGNCGADHLAKLGADLRKPLPGFYKTYQLRCQLTTIMQNYLVDIWMSEYERVKGDKRITNAMDRELEEIQAIMQEHTTQCEDDINYEDNIFGTIDINGNEVQAHAMQPAMQQPNEVIPDAKTDNKTTDKYISKSFPHYKTYDQGSAGMTNAVFTKDIVDHEYPEVKYQANGHRIKIPPHEWEPLAWAFEQLQWEDTMNEDKFQSGITYLELAVLVNIITDGAIAGNRDLDTQAKVCKMALGKFHNVRGTMYPGYANFKQFFQPNAKIATLKPYGLANSPGIQRRPIYAGIPGAGIEARRVMFRAGLQHNQDRAVRFGTAFTYTTRLHHVWKPSAMNEIYKLLHIHPNAKKMVQPAKVKWQDLIPKTEVKQKTGPCHFGHVCTSLKNAKGQPVWTTLHEDYIQGDLTISSVVCQACYISLRKGKMPKHMKNKLKPAGGAVGGGCVRVADHINQPKTTDLSVSSCAVPYEKPTSISNMDYEHKCIDGCPDRQGYSTKGMEREVSQVVPPRTDSTITTIPGGTVPSRQGSSSDVCAQNRLTSSKHHGSIFAPCSAEHYVHDKSNSLCSTHFFIESETSCASDKGASCCSDQVVCSSDRGSAVKAGVDPSTSAALSYPSKGTEQHQQLSQLINLTREPLEHDFPPSLEWGPVGMPQGRTNPEKGCVGPHQESNILPSKNQDSEVVKITSPLLSHRGVEGIEQLQGHRKITHKQSLEWGAVDMPQDDVSHSHGMHDQGVGFIPEGQTHKLLTMQRALKEDMPHHIFRKKFTPAPQRVSLPCPEESLSILSDRVFRNALSLDTPQHIMRNVFKNIFNRHGNRPPD